MIFIFFSYTSDCHHKTGYDIYIFLLHIRLSSQNRVWYLYFSLTHQTVITKQGMIFIFFSYTSDWHHKTGYDNYIVTSYTLCCHHTIRLLYHTIYYFFYWIIRSYMVVHNYWCISLLSEQITHIVSTEVWQ
jgi:hypothetical protein